MYKVSIPINCDKFHRTLDKKLLLDELKAFDADRVMLNFETELDGHVVLYNEDDYNRQLDYMREACIFFKQNGYEVGAWFWGLQFDEGFSFTEIKTLNGNYAKHFACPTDKSFLEKFAQCLKDIAGLGVDIILLNDDLRFGAWNGFGCVCENHIKMICDDLGEQLEEEQLIKLILNGGKNRYRDAFLRANRSSLEGYAQKMREAVDEVNPNIRLGFCACMSSWDIDGDAFELARIFAGNTKPILRLIGAPYWSASKGNVSRLQTIVELERMEASWNQYSDIELKDSLFPFIKGLPFFLFYLSYVSENVYRVFFNFQHGFSDGAVFVGVIMCDTVHNRRGHIQALVIQEQSFFTGNGHFCG